MAEPQRASLTYTAYHWLWGSLDLLLPPRCSGCGCPGNRWCPECARQVVPPASPICEICGVPLARPSALCSDCRNAPPKFSALRSWSIFEGPVRAALHRLKYRRDVGLGEALAPHLAAFVEKLNWPVNLVIPVPLGQKRLSERGYNQVSLIARPLSMAMRLAYAPKELVRSRETRSQVGLTRAERQLNVRDAFRAKTNRVQGQVVLLVDDIATTGSTLSSCAAALYSAGARDVFAFTVSRATPKHGLRTV